MCDYLERMKKIDVPTEEIRLWSGLAHRVVEYTSPFPTPEDVVIMLWLHEESATILLDMCDDIDKKFSELEIENAKLRRQVAQLQNDWRVSEMAMFGCDDYLCEACANFNSDGIDGNHPSCRRQSQWSDHHRAVRLGERCPYGFKAGIPCGYSVHMERNKRRAHEIMRKLGIEVDE